jgi:glutamate racemase
MANASKGAAPIGVFDSGLGGLTVVAAIRRALPAEDIVYLGDTARVPYGTRSARTVLGYARGCARQLQQRGVKVLVIACNTVSAVALDVLGVELDIPVIGVVVPGARAAVRASPGGRIGVLATASTIESGAYPRAIAAADSRAEAITQAAPLLVPLAEEGWTDGEVPALAARRYLEPLTRAGVDSVLLGCTHYPLLRAVIEAEAARQAGRTLPVVDSAQATAEALATVVAERELAARQESGHLRVLVTDMPERFSEAAARFLGTDVDDLDLEAIDL